jgi:hypothetical protein
MEALVATLAIQARRFKLQISANLWETFGDGFLDTTGVESRSSTSTTATSIATTLSRPSETTLRPCGTLTVSARLS